jgi:hypothetical protein
MFLSRRLSVQERNRKVLVGVVVLGASSLVFSWWLLKSFPTSQAFAQPGTSFLERIKIDAQ